jgi:hypothetical protein
VRRDDGRWFGVWAVLGVPFGLAVSAVGLFAVPVALVGAAVLLSRGHGGRAAFGLLAGAAVVPALVAAFNPAYDALHWSLAAASLSALGVGGHWLARRIAP